MVRGTYMVTIMTMLTIVAALMPFPCLALIHGDAGLLKTVALRNKANFESLMTWKGEAFEETISTRQDSYDYMLRSKCTFAYDQLQNAARWNKEPQENRLVVEGESVDDIKASYNSAMVKDQSCYEFSALGQRDDKETFHLVIDDRRRSGNWDNFTFDPRYFFSDLGAGHPLYDRLMFLHDEVKDTPEFGWYVKRAGDLVTLEVSFGENNANTEKYVFDLSAGGNVLRYHNKGPGYENVYEFEYENSSGVWVPKSFKHVNTTQKEDGSLTTARSIRWSNSVVNVPFEEDEFTVEKLGISAGDDIHDHIIGMRYKYMGYVTASEMLKALDTADMPGDTTISDNDGSSEATNEGKTETNKQDANAADTIEERDALQTSETIPTKHETDGKRTPAYVIVVVLVIGLAGIAMLSRRLRS